MKKVVSIFVVLLITLSCCCCAKTSDKAKSEESKKSSLKKVSGEITAASDFSDGVAFVCLDGNKEKTYCINKKGEIIFEINKKMCVNGDIYCSFKNGFAKIEDAICDKKGRITNPQDVGVSAFSLLGIEDGYIIAEINNSSYDATERKIGVMDTSFNWKIKPSAEICKQVEYLPTNLALNTKTYYKNDIVYFDDFDVYFNLKTGAVSKTSDMILPSEKWLVYTGGSHGYWDYKEKEILDLSKKYNNIVHCSEFNYGYAVVEFKNNESNEYFFTLIDEKGKFQFDPISCGKEILSTYTDFDGKNILIGYGGGMLPDNVWCYNKSGKKLCDIKRPSEDMVYSYSLSDGVIRACGGANYSHKCYYYLPNGKKLF